MTEQTATDTTKLAIDITKSTDKYGLFASEAEMDGVDVAASLSRYDDLLVERIQAAYPTAEVQIAARGQVWELGLDEMVNGSDTPACSEAWLVIEDEAQRLLESGDWIVAE